MPHLPEISGANLFAGLFFSSIGFVGFIFGKRLSLLEADVHRDALMAYPLIHRGYPDALCYWRGRNGRSFLGP